MEENISKIHWYPGHMKKASIKIEEKIKFVDFAFILLDSRAPLSTMNTDLLKLLNNKKKVFILTKKDLSDNEITLSWVNALSSNDSIALAISQKNRFDKKIIENLINNIIKEKQEKYLKKGIKNVTCRAIVLGIPNVGKSTFINYLRGGKVAKVANTPGLTKNVTWIKVNKNFELMDTPGILEPNYENRIVSLNLALLGSIKENVLPIEDMVNHILDFLKKYYKKALENRYDITLNANEENIEIIKKIAMKRNFLLKGGNLDLDKTLKIIFKEFKNSEITNFSLERVE